MSENNNEQNNRPAGGRGRGRMGGGGRTYGRNDVWREAKRFKRYRKKIP